VLGGLLLEHYWWGSVFLVNVPVMLLLLVAGPLLLPEYRDPHPGPIDIASAALSLCAVLAVIYGVKELATHGPDAASLLAMATGLLLGAVFLRRQRRLEHPFVDLALFERRPFVVALLVNISGAFFIGGVYLFFAQYLQLVLGFTPWVAGLWSLPSAIAFILASGIVPLMSKRWPARRIMATGLVVAAIGLATIQFAGVHGPVIVLVGALTVMSFGFTPVASLTTDIIVTSAPPERAGSAAALSETAFELGGALGIALLGSLGAAIYRARFAPPEGIDADALDAAGNTLGGAVAAAREWPVIADTLLPAARQAFTEGMLGAAALGALSLFVLAALVQRHLREAGSGEA
jgi:DHA2 family multidrug resistance protein-like MFS transporter